MFCAQIANYEEVTTCLKEDANECEEISEGERRRAPSKVLGCGHGVTCILREHGSISTMMRPCDIEANQLASGLLTLVAVYASYITELSVVIALVQVSKPHEKPRGWC